MSRTAMSIFTIGMLMAGAAGAADEQTRQRIQNEMTASIPAGGVHALHVIRDALRADLPCELPLKQQVEQLRAAAGKPKASDRI